MRIGNPSPLVVSPSGTLAGRVLTVRGVMKERISCTVDELAEALAANGVIGIDVEGMEVDPNVSAREIAIFLNADRIPEPEPVIDTSEDWAYE